MTRLRTYSPVVVWLLVAASCWAFGADAMHHHSLRVVQSPEFGVPLASGEVCPIGHFLQVLQGGDQQTDLTIAPLAPALEPAYSPIAFLSTTEHYSANSPRAPPFSS